MTDIFFNILVSKIEKISLERTRKSVQKISMEPLPPPEDKESVAVDGGGGSTRLLPGRVVRIVRAVAIGDNYMDKDLDVEVSEWESTSALEAARSVLELSLAAKASKVVLVDGSAYTMLSKWITRVVRIARGKAKASEIVALPKTLKALSALEELMKRKDVVFVSKSPLLKLFMEYETTKRLSKDDPKLFERYVRGVMTRKDMMELVYKYKIPMYGSDVDMIQEEGCSYGLQLGLHEPLRKLLVPNAWSRVIRAAIENYKLFMGESYEGPMPKNLCFLPAPVGWWVKIGRWKLFVEEAAGKPLCLAKYRSETDLRPRALPLLVAQAGATYNKWLTLAHALSTLSGEQMMNYVKVIALRLGVSLDELREELIYVS